MKENKSLKNAAKVALLDAMGLQENERLLIVSDALTRDVGSALMDVGSKLVEDVLYIEIKVAERNGQEPPKEVAELMQQYDVVVCATNKSLTHTKARIDACNAGTRVGTMPGITLATLNRCFSAKIDKVVDTTMRVYEEMKKITRVRVTSSLGTDIVFYSESRTIFPSTGVLKNKGQGGNMPSGEVYFAPLEGKTNGVVYFDASIASIGMLSKAIKVEIVDGAISSIQKSCKEAKEFDKMLGKVGKEAYQVAEFGFGTNYKAEICGEILEDEKVLGTIHIAFGNNKSMGGNINVPIHIDALVKEPNVWFDEKLVMKKGKLLI